MQVNACQQTEQCRETQTATSGRDPEKVKSAAQQFEALLIGQMLKAVRESSDSDGWMGTATGAEDSVMDYAEQQLASVLSAKGGLGLATLITNGLTHESEASSNQGQDATTAPASADSSREIGQR